MKRIAQFSYPAMLSAAVALLAFMVLASAIPAQAASDGQGAATAGKASKADRTEVRIKELHTKLMITPEQEGLWTNVAQAMRDDAKTMDALIKARSDGEKTMNAVEDLKSYAEIADAHADGIKKFIPVFEPLYAAMSDAQKKTADTLFRHHGGSKAYHKTKARARVKVK